MDRLVPERLLVFHSVVENGGVTAAARRLHVSQPAVSARIRDLERRLGVELFARGRRAPVLTEAGTQLLETVRRLLAVEQEGLAAILAIGNLEAGRLSVATSETPGHHYLLPLLARFRALHPGIALKLDVSNSPLVLQRVVDGSHDLGFIEGDLSHPAVARDAFRRDPLRLVVSPRHPLASRPRVRLAEVLEHELVMRDLGSAIRTQVDDLFRRANLTPNIAAELNSTEAVKRAVAARLGISFVPTEASRREVSTGALRSPKVLGADLRRTVWQIHRRDETPSVAARAFLLLLAASRVAP